MILENEFSVAAPVDKVWAYFLDVPNLAPCLPGATLVGDDGNGNYEGKVVAALGPVKLNFSANEAFLDKALRMQFDLFEGESLPHTYER